MHLGPTMDEILLSEHDAVNGRHAERPYVLLAQQSLFDDTRSPDGKHTLWGYCHVPNGSDVDMTERIEAQIERFAPGFRDLVEDCVVTPASRMAEHNAAYPDGDISGGAISLWHMVSRPTARMDPYAVAPGVWLCSASTPPGPGVHGMSGLHAARRVLRALGRPVPSLAP